MGRNRSYNQVLVCLRDLASQGGDSVPKNLQHVGQGVSDSMWSLVEDQQGMLARELSEPLFSGVRPSWREACKQELGFRKPERKERRGRHLLPEPVPPESRRRALRRPGAHRDPRPPECRHPTRAPRIRRPASRATIAGVFAVRCARADSSSRGNRVVLKKAWCAAGVFRRDQRDFFEDSKCAQRDILEVADRCRDHIENAGHDRPADSTKCIQPNPFRISSTNTCRTSTKPIPPTRHSTVCTCTTTCSRTSSRQAIDAQVRDLGGLARRLARDRPGAPDGHRTAGTAGVGVEPPGPVVRARGGPDLGAQPAALRRRAGHQPGRAGAVRLRAARRARPPGALEAAAGAPAHPVGAGQHQGAARDLRQGRPREHARDAALHRRGPASRLRRSR